MADEKWLVAGLGNPGSQYEQTRHNVGFMALHTIGRLAGIDGKKEGRFNALVGTGRWAGTPVVLAQPLTYMNLSGQSLGALMQFYKIPPERLLVIYDDIALPLGKIRLRPGGSAGGHNGMKSIIQTLGGNDQFPRLRVGIGAPAGAMTLHDHVLSKFTSEEAQGLEQVLRVTAEAAETVLIQGVETAMNRYNGLEILPPAAEAPPTAHP